jgi:hypothetical protein
VLDLAATIRTTTALPAWLALPQQRMQGATSSMIRCDVLVDALMAGQSRRTGNLLRAVIFAQQRLNTRPVRGVDPGATTGLPTPMPCPHMGRIRGISGWASVALELTTDRAGGSVYSSADRTQAQARFAQRVSLISFCLGQVTSGHGQLHLQVEALRLRHLVLYAPLGCCDSELRPPLPF